MILSFSSQSYSQIVIPSFDPTVMQNNPAAANDRFFGGYYTSFTMKKIEASGTETGDIPEQDLTDIDARWDVEDEVSSFRFLYADVENKFNIFPEILFTKQSLETTSIRTDNTGQDDPSTLVEESDINLVHLNLAKKIFENLNVGIHFGYAKIDQALNAELEVQGGPITESDQADIDMTGYGLGLTYKLPKNLYISGYYAYYGLDQEQNLVANYGEGEEVSTGTFEFEFKSYAYGIAYLIGDKKSKALKVELSEKRNTSEVSPLNKGLRRSLSVEAMNEKFYGGITIAQLKGNTIDFQNIVDTLISERVSSNDTTMNFGLSAGFRTTNGHSFGASGSYSKETIPAQISFINENKFDAETEILTVSVSYSYIVF